MKERLNLVKTVHNYLKEHPGVSFEKAIDALNELSQDESKKYEVYEERK